LELWSLLGLKLCDLTQPEINTYTVWNNTKNRQIRAEKLKNLKWTEMATDPKFPLSIDFAGHRYNSTTAQPVCYI